ncbi:PPE family protein [Mycolicibacillus parakoreensis]|uniref:PPE family protein n=1 Tax=Mycolicibacillus parakoreensis TaxID=1069221 RepID=A0ABY3TZ29_9MYCO|nr:PPE family protein [Mycolicibacillus parakoreensis]MCV7314244.1 PPE family protein [Mycolicibacillus parakoreensis]ULN52955.1 PPE family protein [Mycolicibacillus parakoreensis]HLR99572.1 PPE domain-containing protein [Mycolicibacillus parakoreensis]
MTAPLPPVWIAAPPEVHSTLLNFGGTPVGIEIAATSWKDLMAQYGAAVAELEGILAEVQGAYQGPSAERFVATHQPYLVWLSTAAAKAGLASTAHDEIAAAYTGAVAAMPTMGELVSNHVIHGVLVSTNFFGCNTVPIGMNEADYVRMWILAADVMTGWDTASTAAADSIPLTPPSPILVIPGVAEGGDIAATAAGFSTQAEGEIAGSALTAADLMGTKLGVGKAVSGPASLADGASPDAAARGASRDGGPEQNLDLDTMAPGMLQQFASMVPSAAQGALSALQGGGPQQLLSSAPQLLSSAPQTLGQLLTGFTGSGLDGQLGRPADVMPLGFPGTTAMKGMNPAGLTNLAGGVFDSGPSRPVLPSTWGSAPTTAAQTETASLSRGPAAAAGLTGASAGGSGGGGAMMGSGARRRNDASSRAVTAYADDGGEDESETEPDVRGLTH